MRSPIVDHHRTSINGKTVETGVRQKVVVKNYAISRVSRLISFSSLSLSPAACVQLIRFILICLLIVYFFPPPRIFLF